MIILHSKGQRLLWLGALFALNLSLVADTTNLIPIADTSLHEAFQDSNFGGGPTLTSGGRLMGGRARALLRFDVATKIPAGSTINSAALTVSVSNSNGVNSGSTFVWKRMTTAWGEGVGFDMGAGTTAVAGEATWTNSFWPTLWATPGGDFVAQVSASQTLNAVGPYTFSDAGLAADVQLWLDNPVTNHGWMLQSQDETTAGTIRRFTSRADALNPPKLLVDFTPPAGPLVTPNIFGVAPAGNTIRFSFNGQAGNAYTVDARSSFDTGWSAFTNTSTLAVDTTIHITNAMSTDQKFYRVRTP